MPDTPAEHELIHDWSAVGDDPPPRPAVAMLEARAGAA